MLGLTEGSHGAPVRLRRKLSQMDEEVGLFGKDRYSIIRDTSRVVYKCQHRQSEQLNVMERITLEGSD